jgi:hypothetical protein
MSDDVDGVQGPQPIGAVTMVVESVKHSRNGLHHVEAHNVSPVGLHAPFVRMTLSLRMRRELLPYTEGDHFDIQLGLTRKTP